jgi:hypothetical protein
MEKSKNRNIENLIGIATLLTIIIGFAAVLGAIFCFFTGKFSAGALSLIAAALSFGLFSNAILNN